jgi:hypothetical protein
MEARQGAPAPQRADLSIGNSRAYEVHNPAMTNAMVPHQWGGKCDANAAYEPRVRRRVPPDGARYNGRYVAAGAERNTADRKEDLGAPMQRVRLGPSQVEDKATASRFDPVETLEQLLCLCVAQHEGIGKGDHRPCQEVQ